MAKKTTTKPVRRCANCGDLLDDDEGHPSAIHIGTLCDSCSELEPKYLRVAGALQNAAEVLHDKTPPAKWGAELIYFLAYLEREASSNPAGRAAYLAAVEDLQAALTDRLAVGSWK